MVLTRTGSPSFDYWYELSCALLFWTLLLSYGGLGLYHHVHGNA
jgi:hypothetical protein